MAYQSTHSSKISIIARKPFATAYSTFISKTHITNDTDLSLPIMCHSRNTDKLARFAARFQTDRFLRQITGIAAAPGNHELLHAANAPLLTGTVRYYHLDGSRDDSREIAFLASDGRRAHLINIPLGLADTESQHAIRSVLVLRQRIWLNGGRGEGVDEDFRFVVDGRGTWLVRLRSGDTPPGSAAYFSSDY
jgi:hypothetical protein